MISGHGKGNQPFDGLNTTKDGRIRVNARRSSRSFRRAAPMATYDIVTGASVSPAQDTTDAWRFYFVAVKPQTMSGMTGQRFTN